MDRNIKTHNIKGGKRFLPILSKLRMGYPRLKIMNYQEERPIQIRNELASIANKKVKCIGRFCDIRITNEGFIHILLRDIVVKKGDKEIFLEHCWFIYDKSLMHFDNYEIKPECIISFYATVQQYKNKNRYGLGFPHQFKIIEELKTDEELLVFELKTVKYCKPYIIKHTNEDFGQKGYQQFEAEYGINSRIGTEITLLYNKEKTKDYYLNLLQKDLSEEKFLNQGEIFFNAYIKDKELEQIKLIGFNPYRDAHGIQIDKKYYIPIRWNLHRQLCLMYFLCMYTKFTYNL